MLERKQSLSLQRNWGESFISASTDGQIPHDTKIIILFLLFVKRLGSFLSHKEQHTHYELLPHSSHPVSCAFLLNCDLKFHFANGSLFPSTQLSVKLKKDMNKLKH